MATLCINEYRQLGTDGRGAPVPAPQSPAIATKALPIGGKSVQSDHFSADTYVVEIKAVDARCSIAFGDDPAADGETDILDAGERIFRGVKPGQRLAVIAA